MSEKTKEQLEAELQLHERLAKEREASDEKYAIKLVERIVFSMVALILTSIMLAWLALVVTK